MLIEENSNESSSNAEPESSPYQPMLYQIRIKGHLDADWTDWLDGLTVTLEKSSHTLLTGPGVDQAALHGLLKKIWDLGMALISVNTLEPAAKTSLGSGQADSVDDQP